MVRESQDSVKTPHRIELCEELPIRPVRTCRKRRIITVTPPKTENAKIKAEPTLKKNTVRYNKPLKTSNGLSNMTNGHSIRPKGLKAPVHGVDSHKVTEYFTEQIKSPIKAEPLSPPATEKNFEQTKSFEQTKIFEQTKTFDQIKTVKVIPKISNGDNHKLTEYFPVRRSVRKTSKCVMAEKMRDLERAIREHREDGLAVKYFEAKGRGVVATRPFSRGDFVVEYIGELVGPAEAREREQKYAEDPNAGCYMYYFRHGDQQYCIDATAESNKLGRLVNHSRNGNLATKAVWVDGPRLVLLAAQDISPGEELTYDYGDRSKESLRHHPWLAL